MNILSASSFETGRRQDTLDASLNNQQESLFKPPELIVSCFLKETQNIQSIAHIPEHTKNFL